MQRPFKILSWNIDGLDRLHETLEARTHGVLAVIKREKPDAVFLQEVIPQSLGILRTHLPEYQTFAGAHQGYFVVILTRRSRITVRDHKVIPFPSTTMNRNLLIVHAVYGDNMKIDLMTSHLESRKPAAHERIRQLRFCFQTMIEAPQDRMVFFGGDLNLRDSELTQAGDIPPGIYDTWIETGQSPNHAYTWDMKYNTNLDFPRGDPPRFRFDRLYVRPAPQSRINMKPLSFQLKGQEIIASIKRFSSDHWAILGTFAT